MYVDVINLTIDKADKSTRIILDKMFSAVGIDYSREFFLTTAKSWMYVSTWSSDQRDTFLKWLAEYYQNFMPHKDAQKAACHFVHKFGWKVVG